MNLFFFLFLHINLYADFKVPQLTGPVVDQARVISYGDEVLIEKILLDLKEKGKGQVAIVTIPSLEGEAIEQASIKIADEWKLGSKEKDDGLIVLLAINDRRMRIEVGQGLEGTVTDAMSKRIIEEAFVPAIRSLGVSQGVVAGVQAIHGVLDPDSQSVLQEKAQDTSSSFQSLGKFLNFIFFVFLFFVVILSRIFGFSSRYRTHFGFPHTRSGWSRTGGFGGGGFGGFGGGGGGFSGGGASGGW